MRDTAREQIVNSAMILFWRMGAEVATYNDIVAATGVSRKALYSVWLEKERLVVDALQRYRQQILGSLLRPLMRGDRADLEMFWSNLGKAVRSPDWRGCFLMRTAGGPLRALDEVGEIFGGYIGELHDLIAAAVINGQAEGAIESGIDANAAAWQSVGLINLMSARGAQSGHDEMIEEMISAAKQACGL